MPPTDAGYSSRAQSAQSSTVSIRSSVTSPPGDISPSSLVPTRPPGLFTHLHMSRPTPKAHHTNLSHKLRQEREARERQLQLETAPEASTTSPLQKIGSSFLNLFVCEPGEGGGHSDDEHLNDNKSHDSSSYSSPSPTMDHRQPHRLEATSSFPVAEPCTSERTSSETETLSDSNNTETLRSGSPESSALDRVDSLARMMRESAAVVRHARDAYGLSLEVPPSPVQPQVALATPTPAHSSSPVGQSRAQREAEADACANDAAIAMALASGSLEDTDFRQYHERLQQQHNDEQIAKLIEADARRHYAGRN
eukprot:CAMPEP_0118923138 /NCGR_PEP_ID=MMETSP1169-20130426/1776_1 /TAXON_ID=36882 /ORGANISM="Pyramimonas obovata, Strain CCMP722" /LENGTH=308 /DNA_ID=CAMNT_0006864083 /DNA_START=190 /DNA_END=1113 /DNA_ORIENTATION=+